MPTKSDEIRVRRILDRRGLRLERCRRRDPSAVGFGLYRIVGADGRPLTGGGEYVMTLEQAEEWCERSRSRRRTARGAAMSGTATVSVLEGDALRVLKGLPDRRFQCCVTSPPYWGLRDYATPGQIGRERSPELYAAKLVQVFDEVRRTLRDDGLLFLVVGDTYNTRSKIRDGSRQPSLNGFTDDRWADRAMSGRTRMPVTEGSLKEKDLLLLPYIVAVALRTAGWYLRSDIIWHKTACLPEPVADRPSAAHEHVFMLAKSKDYYFDAAAIAEPAAPASAARYAYGFSNSRPGRGRTTVAGTRVGGGMRNARNVWSIPASGGASGDHPAMMPVALAERCILAGSRPGDEVLDPFGGAGTTALAAAALGRGATLIELSPTYVAAARDRLGRLVRE